MESKPQDTGECFRLIGTRPDSTDRFYERPDDRETTAKRKPGLMVRAFSFRRKRKRFAGNARFRKFRLCGCNRLLHGRLWLCLSQSRMICPVECCPCGNLLVALHVWRKRIRCTRFQPLWAPGIRVSRGVNSPPARAVCQRRKLRCVGEPFPALRALSRFRCTRNLRQRQRTIVNPAVEDRPPPIAYGRKAATVGVLRRGELHA